MRRMRRSRRCGGCNGYVSSSDVVIIIVDRMIAVLRMKKMTMMLVVMMVMMMETMTGGLISVVSALPYGFEDHLVLSTSDGLATPTDFTFLPDGKLVLTNAAGQLLVYSDPDGDNSYPEHVRALDLQPILCINGERGLHGVELHPNFVENRYLYLFYTFNKNDNCAEDPVNGPVNRLSRFVMGTDDVVDPTSEVILVNTPPLEFDHHNSGDITFGRDGYMYVTVGDGGSTWSAVSADPGNILGSIIRLTDEGDIPPDNPFTFQSGETNSVRCHLEGIPPPGSPPNAKCQEIFAYGLRNPFRFAMDPNLDGEDGGAGGVKEVRFLINDVGQAQWEEINEGGTRFAGADYGWPAREGPCRNNQVESCNDAHQYTDPIHYYPHRMIDGLNAGAATGAVFVPPGVWPSPDYDGAYLFADYVFSLIYLMKDTRGPADECRECNPPVSNRVIEDFADFYQTITMRFGPYRDTQALYFCGPVMMRRISYVGDGNRSPIVVVAASQTSGPIGIEIQFTGSDSTDPDGDELAYAWDFDGDGIVDSNVDDPSFTYDKAGLYEAELTLSDGNGGTRTATVEIEVGNKPVPFITNPKEGDTFAVGDILTLSGGALDEDDGIVPPSYLTWEVRQHHAGHYHPFLKPTGGNDILLHPAPQPEDYDAATNSYLEVILTATDKDGLSASVSLDVMPRLVELEIESEPSEMEIFLDGSSLRTPVKATSWENHPLQVYAPDQYVDGQAYVWSAWSDGGGQSHVVTMPENPKKDGLYLLLEFTEFDGTFPPTTGPTTIECIPGSLGIVAYVSHLAQGDVHINYEYGVYAEQFNNGNLRVRRGTPGDPGDIIWESGYEGEIGEYVTRVREMSNMETYRGNPGNIGPVVWQTNTQAVDWNGNYYFGIDCSGDSVAVFQGFRGDPKRGVVWRSDAADAVPRPTSSPITHSPTTSPTTTNPTTSSAPSVCLPGSLGIIAWEVELEQGEVYTNEEFGVYAEQRADGNLLVRGGSPGDPGDLIWESGYVGPVGNYFSRVLANGNLVTYLGTPPEDILGEVWQTGTVVTDPSEEFFFMGIDCLGTVVGVYHGKPGEGGDVVWQSAPLLDRQEPSSTPSSTSPTIIPTLHPSDTPTWHPSSWPSATPSKNDEPSAVPSKNNEPSVIPSVGPSLSSVPSAEAPMVPSSAPSLSVSPTIEDTEGETTLIPPDDSLTPFPTGGREGSTSSGFFQRRPSLGQMIPLSTLTSLLLIVGGGRR